MRYRISDQTLEARIRKRLIENTQWYKGTNNNIEKEEDDEQTTNREIDYGKWKPWKRKRDKRMIVAGLRV